VATCGQIYRLTGPHLRDRRPPGREASAPFASWLSWMMGLFVGEKWEVRPPYSGVLRLRCGQRGCSWPFRQIYSQETLRSCVRGLRPIMGGRLWEPEGMPMAHHVAQRSPNPTRVLAGIGLDSRLDPSTKQFLSRRIAENRLVMSSNEAEHWL